MKLDTLAVQILAKVMAGAVFVSMMVITFYFFLSDVHQYLGEFKQGEFLRMAIYGSLFLTMGLYFVYVSRSKISKDNSTKDQENLSRTLVDVSNLSACFLEGFIKGFDNKHDPQQERNS
jgi:hypothetical protein